MTVLAQQEANDRRATELEDAAKRHRQEVAQAVEDEIVVKLAAERKTITEQESARARRVMDEELQAERNGATQQKERNLILTRKLTIAQAAEADLLKKQQAVDDRERELGLELQRGIAAGLAEVRAKALADAQAGLNLKVQDRDNTITQLRDQITSLQRKAEQSSQQAQGKSLKVVLEHQLRAQFPFDLIEPVARVSSGETFCIMSETIQDSSAARSCGSRSVPKPGRTVG